VEQAPEVSFELTSAVTKQMLRRSRTRKDEGDQIICGSNQHTFSWNSNGLMIDKPSLGQNFD
jgi:hypothetical protein